MWPAVIADINFIKILCAFTKKKHGCKKCNCSEVVFGSFSPLLRYYYLSSARGNKMHAAAIVCSFECSAQRANTDNFQQINHVIDVFLLCESNI